MSDLVISIHTYSVAESNETRASVTVYDKSVDADSPIRTLFEFSQKMSVATLGVHPNDAPAAVAQVLESVLDEIEQGHYLMLGRPLTSLVERAAKELGAPLVP